jgi:hypothetical protein
MYAGYMHTHFSTAIGPPALLTFAVCTIPKDIIQTVNLFVTNTPTVFLAKQKGGKVGGLTDGQANALVSFVSV